MPRLPQTLLTGQSFKPEGTTEGYGGTSKPSFNEEAYPKTAGEYAFRLSFIELQENLRSRDKDHLGLHLDFKNDMLGDSQCCFQGTYAF